MPIYWNRQDYLLKLLKKELEILFCDNMETLEKVIEIVASTCEVDKSEVTGDSTVGDFPAWDSMGHLSILTNVEEAFDICFEPEEMMELEDVNDIVKAVEEKLAE